MSELLSKELLEQILKSTGALGDGAISRVLDGQYPTFSFQVKKRSEFDFALLEDSFDQLTLAFSKDWKENYNLDLKLLRDPSEMMDLRRFNLRESAICLQYRSPLFEGSVFLYVPFTTFFDLLNGFLGGAKFSEKDVKNSLTDIEQAWLKDMAQRLSLVFNQCFSGLDQFNFKLEAAGLADADQKREFEEPHYLTSFLYLKPEGRFVVSLALPTALLAYLKEKMSGAGEGGQDLNPEWKRAVTRAFLETPVDLTVSMGSLVIPFVASVNLKPGDQFFWDKDSTEVTLLEGDRPRMSGTLGVIEENFAVQVTDVWGD